MSAKIAPIEGATSSRTYGTNLAMPAMSSRGFRPNLSESAPTNGLESSSSRLPKVEAREMCATTAAWLLPVSWSAIVLTAMLLIAYCPVRSSWPTESTFTMRPTSMGGPETVTGPASASSEAAMGRWKESATVGGIR